MMTSLRSSLTRAAALLLLVAGGGFAQNTPASAPPPKPDTARKPIPKPPITVSPAEIDLGECRPHEKKPGTFTLTNTGAAPMKVASAKPSCKCTDLEDISGKVIAPGESLSFSVNMKMPAAPGSKRAEVFVTFEGFQAPIVTRLKALIKLAVAADPPHLYAVKDKTTGVAATSGVLTVTSGDGKPFRVLASNMTAPVFVDFDPAKDAPRSSYQLAWDISDWSCEGMRWWWIIETDHPECPILPCEVQHECTGSRADPSIMSRGWFPKDRLVNLNVIKPGEEQTLEIDISPSRDGKVQPITAVESASPHVVASLVEMTPAGTGAVVKFKVRAAESARGLIDTHLIFKSSTGDARTPLIGKAP